MTTFVRDCAALVSMIVFIASVGVLIETVRVLMV